MKNRRAINGPRSNRSHWYPLITCLVLSGCLPGGNSAGTFADSGNSNEKTAVHGEKGIHKKIKSDSALQGTEDAEVDIEAGKLFLWTLPLPSPPWANRYHELAREKGITLKATQTTEEFGSPYIEAYNRRMNEELDKKFGPGILAKLRQQAIDPAER